MFDFRRALFHLQGYTLPRIFWFILEWDYITILLKLPVWQSKPSFFVRHKPLKVNNQQPSLTEPNPPFVSHMPLPHSTLQLTGLQQQRRFCPSRKQWAGQGFGMCCLTWCRLIIQPWQCWWLCPCKFFLFYSSSVGHSLHDNDYSEFSINSAFLLLYTQLH